MESFCLCVCQTNSVFLTFVVNSGDGVSIEHAVEERIGGFRELKDNRGKDQVLITNQQVQHTLTDIQTHKI